MVGRCLGHGDPEAVTPAGGPGAVIGVARRVPQLPRALAQPAPPLSLILPPSASPFPPRQPNSTTTPATPPARCFLWCLPTRPHRGPHASNHSESRLPGFRATHPVDMSRRRAAGSSAVLSAAPHISCAASRAGRSESGLGVEAPRPGIPIGRPGRSVAAPGGRRVGPPHHVALTQGRRP